MHPNNTRGIRPENPFTSGRTRRFKRRSRRPFRGQDSLPPMNTNSNTSFNSRNNNATTATKNKSIRQNATKNKPIRHNATKAKNPIKNKTHTSTSNPILNHYYRQEKLNELHTTIASKY